MLLHSSMVSKNYPNMSNNRISRYKSRHYPKSKGGFALLQEFAMQYYAIFIFVLMIFVMTRVYYQKEILWVAVIGGLGSLSLANLVASVKMHRKIAEILFVNDFNI